MSDLNETLDNIEKELPVEEQFKDELAALEEREGVKEETEVSEEPEKRKPGRPRKKQEGTTEATQVEETVSDNQTEQVEAKPAPKAWAKDKHETWAKLPKEAQDYIETREKQMLDGLDQYKEGYNYGVWINQAITPFEDILQQTNVDAATAVFNMFTKYRGLIEGSQEQRTQALVQIGIDAGIIDPKNVEGYNPELAQMRNEIAQLRQQTAQYKQEYQGLQTKTVEQQLEEFKATHPLLDNVADEFVHFVKAGLDWEKAYESALWSNPAVRQQQIDELTKKREEKKREELDRVKVASSVNVGDTGNRSPTQQKFKNAEDAHRAIANEYFSKQ